MPIYVKENKIINISLAISRFMIPETMNISLEQQTLGKSTNNLSTRQTYSSLLSHNHQINIQAKNTKIN
jgi:hypothetical protein